MTRDLRWLDTLFPTKAERTVPWPKRNSDTVTLWRPVGQQELYLIAQNRYQAFPPRLSDQPIFYPVLNRPYAEEIARDWNAKRNTPPVGFVTEFDVVAKVANRYEIQVVGSQKVHQELWVPAEELIRIPSNSRTVGKAPPARPSPGARTSSYSLRSD